MVSGLADRGRVAAVVVARAGSRGVPGKNVAEIAGKPCVAWSIEHAQRAALVDEVVVSSDSEEVLEIARELGARAHRRSKELATDTARVDDALREAVAWCEAERGPGNRPLGGAVLLYGNVPVRPAGLVDRAVRLWRESGCDSVQSYAPVGKHHPWWQCRLDDEGRVSPWEGERLFGGVYRRQELPPSFVPDGGVVVVSRAALFAETTGADLSGPHGFLGRDHRGVVTGEGEVVDIDSPVDLVVGRVVLDGMHHRGTESTEGKPGKKPQMHTDEHG